MGHKKIAWVLALAAGVPLQGFAEESKKIEDNSFLMEEAYNQEAGVVQHIQSYMYTQKTKDWFILLRRNGQCRIRRISFLTPFLWYM